MNNTVKVVYFGKEINTALDLYNLVNEVAVEEGYFGNYGYIEYDDVRNEITMGSLMTMVDGDSKLVEHRYRLSSRPA